MNEAIIVVVVDKKLRRGLSICGAVLAVLAAALSLTGVIRVIAIAGAVGVAVAYWQFGPSHSYELSGTQLIERAGWRTVVVDLLNIQDVTFQPMLYGPKRVGVRDSVGNSISIAVDSSSDHLRRQLGQCIRSHKPLAALDSRVLRYLFLTSGK